MDLSPEFFKIKIAQNELYLCLDVKILINIFVFICFLKMYNGYNLIKDETGDE